MKNRTKSLDFRIGVILCTMTLIMVVVAFFFTPHDPNAMNSSTRFIGATLSHPLGCDQFGRDTLSRVMVGTRATLVVAIFTVLIGAGAGILIGSITGYFGGIADEVLMRIGDAILSFPAVLLALVFVSILGSGQLNIIMAIGIAFIPSFARLTRSEVVKLRHLEYVLAARLDGAGGLRIIFVHILPNMLPVLLPAMLIGINNAILAETSMSYLGIGIQPPDPSLGRMLAEAQTFLMRAPLMAIAPGVILILMILTFGLLSEAFDE